MPSDKIRENKDFFNQWASSYDNPFLQWWMKKYHHPLFTLIDFSVPATVLDLSCGTGELLAVLQQRNKGMTQLYGLDIAEKMLEEARKKLPSAVILRSGDVHNIPFKNKKFDYVISTEALHHYAQQEKALQEMKRVSTKHVIVVDINFFLPWIHRIFERMEPGCVHINSRREMKTLFENSGLRNIQQQRVFLFGVLTQGEV